MPETPRVTYVSLGSSPELDAAFESALTVVREDLPMAVSCAIGSAEAAAVATNGVLDQVRSPIDDRWVVAQVEQATVAEAEQAQAVAHAAFPAWRSRPWQDRAALLRAAAERIVDRRLELAAWMMVEVGKTRLEALAEVEEAADLLRYYCDRMAAEDGYRRPMARLSPSEATESVLLPYGAWTVIAPFNFPSALAAGMVGAALVTGNTVVLKPAELAPVSPLLLCRALWDAGVPREVLQLVYGPGETVGRALVAHPLAAGVAFTGSYEVGMGIIAGAAREWARPVVVEMGGKNACIVTARAEIGPAALAVARSAFGFGGQKCSACSRAYVEASVYDAFVAALREATATLPVGNPLAAATYVGPVIDERAVARFCAAVDEVRAAGGEILCGGQVLGDGELAHGHYLEPTVAQLPADDHRLWRDELFVPLLLVQPVDNLEAGIEAANRSQFGLTAGLFSADPREVERFLDRIEAGVVYVNRKSGATTGAWPGVNPFGGWKGSGSTGPAALGPHYLLKFLREQSRAVSGVGDGGR